MKFFFWFALAGCAVAAFLVAPRRHEVDGLSMAPGLLPGDVVSSGWIPQADRVTAPRRFERWILAAPDGQPAIKRLVGLPGETVTIIAGDLAVDGAVALTPPTVLAQVASRAGDCAAADGPWQRVFAPGAVYDDADFAPHESRRLLPVRDVGLAAVIDAARIAPGDVAIRVGRRAVRWQLVDPGRYAMVAGRLDGRLVGAAWRLPPGALMHDGRSPLPPQAPQAWAITESWPNDETAATPLGLRITRSGRGCSPQETDQAIESCTAWRDILHRPPASGTYEWQLDPAEIFVLGDFPSGSRDSRHWGPLPIQALHHRGEPSP